MIFHEMVLDSNAEVVLCPQSLHQVSLGPFLHLESTENDTCLYAPSPGCQKE